MEPTNFRIILRNLPSALRNAVYSDITYSQIKDAANLAKLNQDKLSVLTTTVTNVLLGITSLNKFNEELKKRLSIPDANLDIINKVIQQKLFEPLRNDLNQLEINKPKFTFPKIQQKETITPRTSLETPKVETMKTGEIKELAQKPKSLPDLSLPEIQEIKIERPVNRTGEFKRVIVPSVSPEAQEKIHSKLMEAMNKKEVKPKIVEEMKKVVIEGIKKTPQQKPKPKAISETEKPIVSQVIGGENNNFASQEKTQKSPSQKPYIFDVKLKKEKTKKEEIQTEEPIQYKKYQPKKPFGEA